MPTKAIQTFLTGFLGSDGENYLSDSEKGSECLISLIFEVMIMHFLLNKPANPYPCRHHEDSCCDIESLKVQQRQYGYGDNPNNNAR